MNAPQITIRGFLTVLAIAAFIGLIGALDNQHREIKKLEITKCKD